ncbi:type II toxin-antitoxin system death-on-curing family toxin [Candidatus Saccharibacteria bacterium oral taxon 488]|nr:type II toxin-antitoxin system death-on-curing family toxin [Candidatus Saccharibacteria bacterium oral taxon 488]
MVSLTLEQILQLHALVLIRDGGSDGVRDIGRLESVVSAQHQVVFGEELYATVFTKAAALMRGIIGDHPFVDGNKRTAMLAGLTLLEVKGYNFTAQRGELENFAVRVATDQLDIDAIANWLKCHSQVCQ